MDSFDDNLKIVITGCGMVSPLGLDVANACAAARAGITRASSMDVYPVRSPQDGSASGVVCHAVPFLTDGFEGEARLIRLIQGGLEDLARQCLEAPWKTKRTAFYLSLPGAHRLTMGANLVADQGDREEMEKTAKAQGGHAADLERARRLLAKGAQWSGWPTEPLLRWCTESGSTGVAEAMRQAASDLQANVCELAIVGGVDSLLDEETLAWLELIGRLKSPDVASGLQPGEACGFLILETYAAASSRAAHILARVNNICFVDEANPLFSGELANGVALAATLNSTIKSLSNEEPHSIWLLNDLNGESHRSHEWGGALFRLAAQSRAWAEPKVWVPAMSFGDVGAVTGVVQASLVIQAFRHKYAPQSVVKLLSTSEDALRSCVDLTYT